MKIISQVECFVLLLLFACLTFYVFIVAVLNTPTSDRLYRKCKTYIIIFGLLIDEFFLHNHVLLILVHQYYVDHVQQYLNKKKNIKMINKLNISLLNYVTAACFSSSAFCICSERDFIPS
jgi:hypothetical protein